MGIGDPILNRTAGHSATDLLSIDRLGRLPASPVRCDIVQAPMTIIESARALLVDPQQRVLLMRLAFDAHQTYWLTPAGSLHRGETFEEALRREIL